MRDELRPSRIGAPGSLNTDTRNVGRAVPAFKQFVVRDSDLKHYAAGVSEYKAPTGTTTGAAPRLYWGVNKEMRRDDNGTETSDVTFTDVVQGQVIADTGGFIGTATSVAATTVTDTHLNLATSASGFTSFVGRTIHMGDVHAVITSNTATVWTFSAGWLDATGAAASTPTAGFYTVESSGSPNLVVGFGSSATEFIAYRDLSTDTTPWTQVTSDSTGKYARFWLITRIGGAGYAAMTDAGATALGEWRVSICPAGNDIRLASSWGNGFEIGGPEWGTTGLSAIGNAPVVGKPDGLYYYDLQTRRYENVLKHLEIVPHALNGKVTEAVTGGVIYTTHDGHCYFFDGVGVTEVSPNKFWPILSRDIGNSRITAVADNGETIAMVTETAYQTTQNATLTINKVTAAGAATDITTNMVDGSMATGGNVNSLAATSFIDVWSSIPFEGVVMHVTRQPNATTTAVFGSVSYSSATDTFTAATGIIDGTRLSSGGSLSYVAFPPSASSGVVMAKDLNFGSLQQAVNFTYASGGTNVTAKYGMRIAMSGAALSASTEIDEIEIIPARAGMPNGGIYSSTTNFTPRDRAGLVAHVYLIKREHTTGFTPHDSYACYAYPGVWKMAWHTGRNGQASGGQNLGQSLYLLGRYRTIAISESQTRDPVRTRYPILQGVGTVAPGPLQQIGYEWAGKPGEESEYKQIDAITLDSRFVQPGDQTELFIEHEGRDIISLGVYVGGPLVIKPANISPCRFANLWVGFKQNATTLPNAPYFVEPFLIDYHIVDMDSVRDPATSTPELT